MTRRVLVLLLALTTPLAACDDGGGPDRPDATGGDVDAGRPAGAPTYYGDIRPIMVGECTTCHEPGGIAPFALETYEQTREVGNRIQEVTEQRLMPPFLADNSGECQTWSNHRGLTDAEIALIGDWVAGGMLEGDPTTPAPDPTELATLPRVDLTLEMPAEYTIDGSSDDDYRCFLVDTGLTDPVLLTGYEVNPGNAQRVHHVITYNPVDASAAQSARDLDMADGVAGDGYPCFGGPRVNAPPLTLWAPGAGAVQFPRGTGIQITPGVAQVVQIHYNNLVEGSANTDRTTIDLMTVPMDGAVPAAFFPFADVSLAIPPRTEMHEESQQQSLGPIFNGLPVTSLRVFGVLPHMHTLGRSLNVTVNRIDADECLIEVPRWDFNWQLPYWLDTPVRVGSGDAATITCRYNSMERDTVTTWGDGTQDEMCLAFVYVSL